MSENLFFKNARKRVYFHLICIKGMHFHEKECVLCKLVAFSLFSCGNARFSIKMCAFSRRWVKCAHFERPLPVWVIFWLEGCKWCTDSGV